MIIIKSLFAHARVLLKTIVFSYITDMNIIMSCGTLMLLNIYILSISLYKNSSHAGTPRRSFKLAD